MHPTTTTTTTEQRGSTSTTNKQRPAERTLEVAGRDAVLALLLLLVQGVRQVAPLDAGDRLLHLQHEPVLLAHQRALGL